MGLTRHQVTYHVPDVRGLDMLRVLDEHRAFATVCPQRQWHLVEYREGDPALGAADLYQVLPAVAAEVPAGAAQRTVCEVPAGADGFYPVSTAWTKFSNYFAQAEPALWSCQALMNRPRIRPETVAARVRALVDFDMRAERSWS